MSEKQNGSKSRSLGIVLLSIVAIAAIVLAVIGFMGQSSLSNQVNELNAKIESSNAQIADYEQQKQEAKAAADAADAAVVVAADAAAAAEAAAAKATAEAADAVAAAEAAVAKATAEAADAVAAAEAAAAKATAEAADAVAAAEAAATEAAATLAAAEAAATEAAAVEVSAEAADTAEGTESVPTEAVAFLMFADGSWTNQYWTTQDVVPFTVTSTVVTGPNTYTVGLTFEEAVQGLAFLALGIENGEALLPGAVYEVTEVKVDGVPITLGKTYTSTDEGVITRNNIYNEWVGEIPEDARVAGDIAEYTPTAVSLDDFASYKSIEVTFTMLSTEAFIMFANADWSRQLWANESDGTMEIGAAQIYMEGDYEVSLNLQTPVEGFAFMALQVVNGNLTFPNYCYDITEILIDGTPVEIGKSYTSSDDGIETRSNIYNEWVAELPSDARTGDGDLTDCSPILFAANTTTATEIVVKFTVSFVVLQAAEEEVKISETNEYPAFLMIADNEWAGAWANQNPGTAGDTLVTGDGIYEVKASKDTLGIAADAEFGTLSVLLVDIVDFGSAILQTNGYSYKDTDYISSVSENNLLNVGVALYVDGVKVSVEQDLVVFGNIEGNHRLRIELYNVWGPTAQAPAVAEAKVMPTNEVVIVFSIEGSGINTGADTDLDAYCAANYPQ